METLETPQRAARVERPTRDRRELPALDWGAIATWALAAILVVYLGLENGGYDPIPRNQTGFLVWWALLLGVGIGALPVPGRSRAALATLGLLFAFAIWTALSLGWTESAERTAEELARVAGYLGVLALGICLVTRRRAGARQVLHGVAFALAALAALGVLSRLQMAWFPANELGGVLPGIEIERRLAYPLGYSSAVGAMAGMALPLLLAATASARTVAVQALAAAALPIAGLTLYLSTSSTGAGVSIVALAVFLALSPDRLPKLLTLAVAAGGAAVLASAVHAREALARGLPSAGAEQQGAEVIWIAVGVCLVVALAQAGIGLALRDRWPGSLPVGRASALAAVGVAVIVAVSVAVAADVPGELSHRWEVFKSRDGDGESSASSSLDFRGNGRYQFWEAAVDSSQTAPWSGTGPGTFEFWWSRHGSYRGFVRDAHSLYLESLGEQGIVGVALIVGFVLTLLGCGPARALRAPPEQRLVLAAATAGAAGFAAAAALDWVWELAALAVAFMLLVAVAVAGFSQPEPTKRRRRRGRRRRNRLQRVAVAGVAIAAMVAIWSPLRGATALQQSRIEAAEGDVPAALDEARRAADNEPYAASPRLQEALLLERQGRFALAAAAASEAAGKESTNWRNWLILARIEAERGRIEPALRGFTRARSLNPGSGLLEPR